MALSAWRYSKREGLPPVYQQPAPELRVPEIKNAGAEFAKPFATAMEKKKEREARMAELDAQLQGNVLRDELGHERDLEADQIKRERERSDKEWAMDLALKKRGTVLGERRKRVLGMMGEDVGAAAGTASGVVSPSEPGSILNSTLSKMGRGDIDPEVGPTLPPRDPRRFRQIEGTDQYDYDTAPDEEIDLENRTLDSLQQWKQGRKVSPKEQAAYMDARRSVESQDLKKERESAFLASNKRMDEAKPKPIDIGQKGPIETEKDPALLVYKMVADTTGSEAEAQNAYDEYKRKSATSIDGEGEQPDPRQFVNKYAYDRLTPAERKALAEKMKR